MTLIKLIYSKEKILSDLKDSSLQDKIEFQSIKEKVDEYLTLMNFIATIIKLNTSKICHEGISFIKKELII